MIPNESILLELKKIEQMSDCGSHELTIMRMKSIATEAIKKWEDSASSYKVKKDDSTINHLRNVKLLQAIYSGKKFYVECFPTDTDAIHFPNSNMAVKEIELPNFSLYEEKLGYRWMRQSVPPYKEEVDKEDELWEEVMKEMGFYSSQLDNIKSKFHLTRKV